MKFVCGTPPLREALQLVSRAVSAQQALPILHNVHLRVAGGVCTMTATDLEVSIITNFPASVEIEGAVTVPVKAIMNFAQYCSDEEVMIEVTEGAQLHCRTKRTKTLLAGERAQEYPSIPAIESQQSFTLEARPFLHALQLITFASAKSGLRPVLSGVSVRSQGGVLTLAATDSYRLSEYKIPIPDLTEEVACIVPTRVLEELRSILGGGKESDRVTITLSKQQIQFSFEQTQILSRLIDGKFPNYEAIIPKQSVTTCRLDTGPLLTTIKRMHYFTREVNNTLTLSCTKAGVHLTTPQTQGGRDESELPCEVSGSDNTIALSSAYLLDFLSHTSSASVEMRMSDSSHPAIFVIPGEVGYLHLIMPLRLPTS